MECFRTCCQRDTFRTENCVQDGARDCEEALNEDENLKSNSQSENSSDFKMEGKKNLYLVKKRKKSLCLYFHNKDNRGAFESSALQPLSAAECVDYQRSRPCLQLSAYHVSASDVGASSFMSTPSDQACRSFFQKNIQTLANLDEGTCPSTLVCVTEMREKQL